MIQFSRTFYFRFIVLYLSLFLPSFVMFFLLLSIDFFYFSIQFYDCRNHVRVIQPMGDGSRLYVCGTNAHNPKDWVINVSTQNIHFNFFIANAKNVSHIQKGKKKNDG